MVITVYKIVFFCRTRNSKNGRAKNENIFRVPGFQYKRIFYPKLSKLLFSIVEGKNTFLFFNGYDFKKNSLPGGRELTFYTAKNASSSFSVSSDFSSDV